MYETDTNVHDTIFANPLYSICPIVVLLDYKVFGLPRAFPKKSFLLPTALVK